MSCRQCRGRRDQPDNTRDPAICTNGCLATGPATTFLALGFGRARRVTFAEARAASWGAPIPVTRDHPLYQFMRDGDGDGQVCESVQ